MKMEEGLKDARVLDMVETDESGEPLIYNLVQEIYDDMYADMTRLSMSVKHTEDASLIKRKIDEVRMKYVKQTVSTNTKGEEDD